MLPVCHNQLLIFLTNNTLLHCIDEDEVPNSDLPHNSNGMEQPGTEQTDWEIGKSF